MAKDKGGAEEEKDKLGRYLLQMLAQEDTLKALEQKDFANQVTLVAILAQLDIRLSALRDALRGAGTRDFTTLETDIEAILARLNVNLSTRASETTLATRLNITLSALRDALKGASNKDLSTLEADLETMAGDTPALNDDSIKGLMRSMGNAGTTPTNKTGKTLLKLLDEILTQTSDHAFGMMGYDYTGAAQAQLAVDPATKALLVKHTAATVVFSFAIPIDTPESTGTDKGVFHFAPGVAGTIDEVYIMAKTAPGTDKTLTVDVNKAGTTIFTTQANRPSLVDTAKTATSGTPDVATFVKNDLFTIDVDVSTATTAVADVILFIRGKQKVA